MYIDGLLQRLCEAKKVGCWIGNVYVGALADADDVTLLAPGHRAMRLQLQICEEYGREFRIVFNAERSVWLRVSKKPSHSDDSLQFWIDGTVRVKLSLLGWMTTVKYLLKEPPPFRLAASVLWCWSWEKEGRAVEVVPGI